MVGNGVRVVKWLVALFVAAHVIPLVLGMLFIVDTTTWQSCVHAEDMLCRGGACPDESAIERDGELAQTHALVRRNSRIALRQGGGWATQHPERRWAHFLEHEDRYTMTSTDMFPALYGVDLDGAEEYGLWKWFWETPRDRASLISALTRTLHAPELPAFLHHHWMGFLDRAPTPLDPPALIYQVFRSTGFRFFSGGPMCTMDADDAELAALRAKADAGDRAACTAWEAQSLSLAVNAISTGLGEAAVRYLEPVCSAPCAPDAADCRAVLPREGAPRHKASRMLRRLLLLAEFRRGELDNCVKRHTGESCLLPLEGSAVHMDPSGAAAALEWARRELGAFPDDQHAKFFANLAAMQLDRYPAAAVEAGSAPFAPLESGDLPVPVPRFANLAKPLGLGFGGITGAQCVDDFFGDDGLLDVLQGSIIQWADGPKALHAMRNVGDGTFEDVSAASKLNGVSNVWNLKQADYDRDGDLDVYVARGGWAPVLQLPQSLLRNNGDGTFTEVTRAAGLFAQRGSQTAEWRDYDLDGWPDLLVGFEQNPCGLYHNNGDGTFTDVAVAMGVDQCGIAKGVTWADVNDDGYGDVVISQFGGKNKLFLNPGAAGGAFRDVTDERGATEPRISYPVVAFDVDNDGDDDLLFAGHRARDPGEVYAFYANETWAEQGLIDSRLGADAARSRLYINDGTGHFAESRQPIQIMGAMGFNVVDVNNDGFLDAYFGTGMPDMRGLDPNLLFVNVGGTRFEDATFAARLGHLQKGHAISIGDLDNDGAQDILANMGGAFVGDSVPDAAFLNPGVGGRGARWLKISLKGNASDTFGLGAKLAVRVATASGAERTVYSRQGLTASYGSTPVSVQHVGLGDAVAVLDVTVRWPHRDLVGAPEVFVKNLKPDTWVVLAEGRGDAGATVRDLPTVAFDRGALAAEDKECGCSLHV